jgi:sugar phosphate permease
MMIARRVGMYFQMKGRTIGYIGWSLFVQGIFFALMGVMPSLGLASLCLFVSRVLLGAEFAVQETLLMRLVPDYLRGRVSTSDRAGEMLIWSLSTGVAGWSLYHITPHSLTLISGLLSGVAGLLWLVLFPRGPSGCHGGWRRSLKHTDRDGSCYNSRPCASGHVVENLSLSSSRWA